MNERDSLKVNSMGHLEIGGVDTTELAKKYGTPLYVMDESYIRKMCRTYKETMDKNYGYGMVLYASKAFSCKGIYNIANSEGVGVDTVSLGEMATAKSVNFPAEKIYFHGNNKTREEIEFALEYGINTIVLDGLDEIDFVNEICKEKGKNQKVLIRTNPGIEAHTHSYIQTTRTDSKFGVLVSNGDALKAVEKILNSSNLVFYGLHCHIGSQIFEPESFVKAAEMIVDFVKEIKDKLGFTIKELNFGGGFGIWYTDNDKKMKEQDYANYILSLINVLNSYIDKGEIEKPFLVIEPGRSMVGEAGITLYEVGNQKIIKDIKHYVAVNGGMFDNPRNALYQADYTAVLASDMNRKIKNKVTIAGKCCESGDIIARDVMLPEVARGELIAVLSTGAYNYSMASNYNRNLVPPVVIVKDGKSDYLIKPQTYTQIMQNDNIPSFD